MNEFDVCSLFPAYSKCINNANKSIVICCFGNTETFHLQAKNTEISKNIAIFQKHVRVSMSEFKSKRNFTFVCFGNQTMALMAATKFEKDVLCVMAEFEKVTRKPTLRQNLLTAHGVDSSFFKKSVSNQREQLLHRLFQGSSTHVEDGIIESMCQSIHEPALLKVSSVKRTGVGYCAKFEGPHQTLEQSCKSFKSASDWLVQMYTANKDRLRITNYIYIYIMHVYIYTYDTTVGICRICGPMGHYYVLLIIVHQCLFVKKGSVVVLIYICITRDIILL